MHLRYPEINRGGRILYPAPGFRVLHGSTILNSDHILDLVIDVNGLKYSTVQCRQVQ